MLHLNHLKKSFGKTEVLTDVEYIFNKGRSTSPAFMYANIKNAYFY